VKWSARGADPTWLEFVMLNFYLSVMASLLTLSCFEMHAYSAEPKPATISETALRSDSVTIKDITLSVELPPEIYSGAENLITLVLQNEGELPAEFIPVDLGYVGPRFKVFRNGEEVKPTAHGAQYLIRSLENPETATVKIKSGQEIWAVVNLTRYYDLSIVGEYQLVASWVGYTDPKLAEPIRLKTKPITFEVKLKPGELVTNK